MIGRVEVEEKKEGNKVVRNFFFLFRGGPCVILIKNLIWKIYIFGRTDLK